MDVSFFFLDSSGEEPESDSRPDLAVRLSHDGVYYFLYPYLLNVQQETGQLIEPCGHARFEAEQVPSLSKHLSAAREAAERQPDSVRVYVGRQIRPVLEERYEKVSRSDLLELTDDLLRFVREAERQGKGVLCVSP